MQSCQNRAISLPKQNARDEPLFENDDIIVIVRRYLSGSKSKLLETSVFIPDTVLEVILILPSEN